MGINKIIQLVDTVISHNEIIAIWCVETKQTSKLLWRGQAWKMPDEYKGLRFVRIFGAIPEKITEADTINILAEK